MCALEHDDRRIGVFRIPMVMVRKHPQDVANAMAGCVVVRAEMLFEAGAIEYVALHPAFAVLPLGQQAPTYHSIITRHEDGSVAYSWRSLPIGPAEED
jgi:hypothetical protein